MWNWLISKHGALLLFRLHLDGHNMEVIFVITCWSVWLYQVWFFEEFYTCSFTKMIFACVYWIQIRWVVGKVSLILDTVLLFHTASSLFSLCWEFYNNYFSWWTSTYTCTKEYLSCFKLNSCHRVSKFLLWDPMCLFRLWGCKIWFEEFTFTVLFSDFHFGLCNFLNNTWFNPVLPKQCVVVLVISIPFVAWQGHF